jgi:hypothetical protein
LIRILKKPLESTQTPSHAISSATGRESLVAQCPGVGEKMQVLDSVKRNIKIEQFKIIPFAISRLKSFSFNA